MPASGTILPPLDSEHDLAGHAVGYDLVMLHHAFGLLDAKRHDATQGLGGFGHGEATRIVEADFGLHGDINVAHDRHASLPGSGLDHPHRGKWRRGRQTGLGVINRPYPPSRIVGSTLLD